MGGSVLGHHEYSQSAPKSADKRGMAEVCLNEAHQHSIYEVAWG